MGSHPNQSVIDGLLGVANWLNNHPELPQARFSCVSLRAANDGQPARETLELVARTLGGMAQESVEPGGQVVVSARFAAVPGRNTGGVRVIASASLRELADVPPEQLPYEPIIKPSLEAVPSWVAA